MKVRIHSHVGFGIGSFKSGNVIRCISSPSTNSDNSDLNTLLLVCRDDKCIKLVDIQSGEIWGTRTDAHRFQLVDGIFVETTEGDS